MNSLELTLVITAAVLLGPVTLVALLNLLVWPRRLNKSAVGIGQVSVLVPARNEMDNLEACVDSALAQGPIVKEILIYNDGSTDSTQQVIDQLVSAHQDTVRQVQTENLPAGWVGKSHACKRLAEHALAPWLLFIDADTRLQEDAARSLVAEAQHRKATLLSAWPKIEMNSFAERFLMPLLNFVVFTLFPAPISRRRTGPSLGLAHGACILAHRETYERLRGHELVKDRLFEDTALARAWREASENSQVADGRNVATVRMYESFGGIWNGFSKNYYPAFGNLRSFAIFQLYMVTAFVALPLFTVISFINGAIDPAFLFIVVGSLAPRSLVALRFRHPLWSVPLHPLAITVMVVLGLRSWWRSSLGGGVSWKGRTYMSSGIVVTDD
ncbi:MAG: glycosyltransferase family 2 protein [Chloroflexi bacterium]|nr:glycosyltransferase family 2 protein [Chloroflexota bacterium]